MITDINLLLSLCINHITIIKYLIIMNSSVFYSLSNQIWFSFSPSSPPFLSSLINSLSHILPSSPPSVPPHTANSFTHLPVVPKEKEFLEGSPDRCRELLA